METMDNMKIETLNNMETIDNMKIDTMDEQNEKIKVRGFFKAQIIDPKTGKINGDSGWVKNTLTQAGLKNLCDFIVGGTGYAVGYIAAGTQTAVPSVTQTDLAGQTASWIAVVTSTTTASTGATGTFTVDIGSANLTASCNVGAVGLYRSSSAGSLYALQTFGTSSWNTNQDKHYCPIYPKGYAA